jgi:hypothetical protein
MATNRGVFPVLPIGEQPAVERVSTETAVADTFAGRVHVEWDDAARVTPLGQLPFFIEYVKLGGLFDGWVSGCPLYFSSPNAPSKRDVLGTVLLSVLAGHWRYAHMTTLRCDPVNPPLLGMRKVISEDAVRRGFDKIEEDAGLSWLQEHLDYCTRPLLGEPWILDVDTTVKPLYGHQEGAVVSYNPHKPGRPSHSYHLYARQLASHPGGGSASRQSSYVEAFGAGPLAPAGRAFADGKAHVAARRRRLGQRADHAGGGAAWPALSVQVAPDEWGEACDRASDAHAGLA